jgi:hypothetical protein
MVHRIDEYGEVQFTQSEMATIAEAAGQLLDSGAPDSLDFW